MSSWEILLYISVFLLCFTLILDIGYTYVVKEGFLVSPGDNKFLTQYFPRRGDISFGTEESGYVQDRRNVMGYADVQGLGVSADFCRMVVPKAGIDQESFFACALAGTENLSSTAYKTLAIKDGFKTSRDDYMRDANKDGRTEYCAIIKISKNQWDTQCYRALAASFDTRPFTDTEPPEDIARVLSFYDGILFWFRFIDDMKDYAENVNVSIAGGLTIDESDVKPLPSQILTGSRTTNLDERSQMTQGLSFNGIDQYLRIGDSPDLSFGQRVLLRTMRSLCFWVKFDEFTNNAHILDFGDGAGINNIFVGIIGRGDESVEKGSTIRKSACESNDLNNVLPDTPSGAQPVPDLTPMQLMLSTSANVDNLPCEEAILPRKLKPLKPLQEEAVKKGVLAQTASLLYEVWNGKLRMQHIVSLKAFTLKKWTHVCITTASGDGVRPALQIWVNGTKVSEDPSAHLPQASFTSNNYIGKSNWVSDSSQYENRAELFRGSLFDIRGYNKMIDKEKLKNTLEWGKLRLGIKD
jgi:hypothetical protein